MRFATLEPEQMSAAQKRAYDAIVSGPRGGARGPFNVLLRSPELAERVQKVGEPS
jgi:4-carboxymuconolactone decarboxylase